MEHSTIQKHKFVSAIANGEINPKDLPKPSLETRWLIDGPADLLEPYCDVDIYWTSHYREATTSRRITCAELQAMVKYAEECGLLVWSSMTEVSHLPVRDDVRLPAITHEMIIAHSLARLKSEAL